MLSKAEITAAINASLAAAGIEKEVGTVVEVAAHNVANLPFEEDVFYYGCITASKVNTSLSMNVALKRGLTEGEGQDTLVTIRTGADEDKPVQLDHVVVTSSQSTNANVQLTGYKIPLVATEP